MDEEYNMFRNNLSFQYILEWLQKKPKFPLEAITGILVAIVLIQVVTLSLSLDLTQHEQQVWAGAFAVLCSIPNPIVVLDRLLVAIFDAAVRREIK